MHAWESIQKVLDYIEENIAQSHSPEELSKVAALSPFYFQRLFARLVKRPVNEYAKMRRLARACETLHDKNKRILDIALSYGFNSHERFTKTFKSAYGITPEAYRKNPVRLNQVIKPDLLLGYTMIDENVPLIADGIVLEIFRKTIDAAELYIGLTAQVPIAQQTPLGETTGIDVPGQLWDKFHNKKTAIRGLAPDGAEFGVASFNSGSKGVFTYFAGAAAVPGAAENGEFAFWELPAGEYIVCSFEAEGLEDLVNIALHKSMHYLFDTWLPKKNLWAQPFCAEKYVNPVSEVCRMELWVLPVPAKV